MNNIKATIELNYPEESVKKFALYYGWVEKVQGTNGDGDPLVDENGKEIVVDSPVTFVEYARKMLYQEIARLFRNINRDIIEGAIKQAQEHVTQVIDTSVEAGLKINLE